MAGKTGHWLKDLANISPIREEHLQTREEEGAVMKLRNRTSKAEGSSPVLLRRRCITKGRRGTVLDHTARAGTPMQR